MSRTGRGHTPQTSPHLTHRVLCVCTHRTRMTGRALGTAIGTGLTVQWTCLLPACLRARSMRALVTGLGSEGLEACALRAGSREGRWEVVVLTVGPV